jgi:hypothetical protein
VDLAAHSTQDCFENPQFSGLIFPLVILGGRDFAGPADRLVAALPDVRFVPLPGTDHFGTPRDFRFIQATLDVLSG